MLDPQDSSVEISVIVPVLDGLRQLEVSLPALFQALKARSYELIVVDDGSSDGSASYAASLGARVLETGGRGRGPAVARNIGAFAARSERLLFVDADVAVHPDTIGHIVQAFERPEVVAIFGAYDDEPPDASFASQYMNLRHHHVHQTGTSEAQTFWTGLGAVRTDAFRAVDGFDAEQYPRPSIEDIDLGRRLRAAGGKILRWPAMRGTHLKRWSLPEVIRTDVMRRALPWARLMQCYPGAFSDLNVGRAERLKALVAVFLVLTLSAAMFKPAFFWVTGLFALMALGLNWGLLRVFHGRNGPWFAAQALIYHQLYYLYSAAVFAWAALEHRLFVDSSPSS